MFILVYFKLLFFQLFWQTDKKASWIFMNAFLSSSNNKQNKAFFTVASAQTVLDVYLLLAKRKVPKPY